MIVAAMKADTEWLISASAVAEQRKLYPYAKYQ